MTLQDFKDQVAKEWAVEKMLPMRTFDELVYSWNGHPFVLIGITDRAAELYAKEREAAVRKWTFSVEELPEKGLPVLIWQEGWDKPSIGSLKIPDFRDPLDSIFDTRGSFQSGFTHWMPLPDTSNL